MGTVMRCIMRQRNSFILCCTRSAFDFKLCGVYSYSSIILYKFCFIVNYLSDDVRANVYLKYLKITYTTHNVKRCSNGAAVEMKKINEDKKVAGRVF